MFGFSGGELLWVITMTMGMHIIMELYGCPSELIAHVSNVKRIFDELIEEAEIN